MRASPPYSGDVAVPPPSGPSGMGVPIPFVSVAVMGPQMPLTIAAAVVMSCCAFSRPLSAHAQTLKRGSWLPESAHVAHLDGCVSASAPALPTLALGCAAKTLFGSVGRTRKGATRAWSSEAIDGSISAMAGSTPSSVPGAPVAYSGGRPGRLSAASAR